MTGVCRALWVLCFEIKASGRSGKRLPYRKTDSSVKGGGTGWALHAYCGHRWQIVLKSLWSSHDRRMVYPSISHGDCITYPTIYLHLALSSAQPGSSDEVSSAERSLTEASSTRQWNSSFRSQGLHPYFEELPEMRGCWRLHASDT